MLGELDAAIRSRPRLLWCGPGQAQPRIASGRRLPRKRPYPPRPTLFCTPGCDRSLSAPSPRLCGRGVMIMPHQLDRTGTRTTGFALEWMLLTLGRWEGGVWLRTFVPLSTQRLSFLQSTVKQAMRFDLPHLASRLDRHEKVFTTRIRIRIRISLCSALSLHLPSECATHRSIHGLCSARSRWSVLVLVVPALGPSCSFALFYIGRGRHVRDKIITNKIDFSLSLPLSLAFVRRG
ncbi:hypothetical protein LZ30DRAFT_398394 [Colletotrichum cereale]|nr:hypothetical protein LZ30DRAFT_398394 [Colletotrichum cereale]